MPALPFVVVPTPLGTLTTSSAHAANPVTHLNEFDSIGMTWKATSDDAQFVRGDFGSAKPVDFLSVVAASVNPAASVMRLRLGASQAAVDGAASYDSGLVLMVQPAITRADGLYVAHLELPAIQTYRWWRLDFAGLLGVQLEASAIVLGQKLVPATWYSAGYEYGVEDMGEIDIGRYGIPEETPGRIMRTLAFQLGWLSETDFETKFRPLAETLGKRRVAFWCFDPTANAYRQNRTYFGWLRPPPVARHTATTPDGPRFLKDFEILSMI